MRYPEQFETERFPSLLTYYLYIGFDQELFFSTLKQIFWNEGGSSLSYCLYVGPTLSRNLGAILEQFDDELRARRIQLGFPDNVVYQVNEGNFQDSIIFTYE